MNYVPLLYEENFLKSNFSQIGAGAFGGLQCTSRNFWLPEVPDSQGIWKPRSLAVGTYVVTVYSVELLVIPFITCFFETLS